MIFKRGDVYRNKESNTLCYIKDEQGDWEYDWAYLLCWSYQHDELGYRRYEGWYTHGELLNEMSKGYLDVVSYGDKETLIYNWIPQYNFLPLY
jgi:hypothetical protein